MEPIKGASCNTSLEIFLLYVLVLFTATILAVPLRAKDEKLKAEQVIAKHLESIGTADKLKEIKTRATNGSAHVDFRVGGQANLPAEANLFSDGASLRFSLRTPALEYPGEQFAFDGNKVVVGQIGPGRRSNLGQFLFENDELLKDGLLFGTLTTSWTFLNTGAKPPKLDLNGPKKVDGRSVYEVKYLPKKGGNITAFFYFDAESFRHVRSQFKAEIVPTAVGQKITDSAETIRYTITETFDDFSNDSMGSHCRNPTNWIFPSIIPAADSSATGAMTSNKSATTSRSIGRCSRSIRRGCFCRRGL